MEKGKDALKDHEELRLAMDIAQNQEKYKDPEYLKALALEKGTEKLKEQAEYKEYAAIYEQTNSYDKMKGFAFS